ncbi:MAG: hypothetical protein KGJ88_08425 [Verrucomicrobiota bacterium]|nr:hypothetical protein [Verrucomicrobiota bacterium]
MKVRFLIPLLLLTGCASPRIVQMPPLVPGAAATESVRYPEIVKSYYVGRYIDPDNPGIMHGRQVLYRVETPARWNLHPGGSSVTSPSGLAMAATNSAYVNPPINAAVIAEVNKQRAATQTLLNEGAKLNQTLSQLPAAFNAVKQVEQQNLQLKQELTATENRLDALEVELRNKPADSLGTNQTTNEW